MTDCLSATWFFVWEAQISTLVDFSMLFLQEVGMDEECRFKIPHAITLNLLSTGRRSLLTRLSPYRKLAKPEIPAIKPETP